jgi:hypothetical protein
MPVGGAYWPNDTQGPSQDYIYAYQKACRYNNDTPSRGDIFSEL